MVDGAFAIIARQLRVKMNASCADLHEHVVVKVYHQLNR